MNFCLFKMLGTYLDLIFFFAMFRTKRGQRRKKTEIEQSDHKVVFKGTN